MNTYASKTAEAATAGTLSSFGTFGAGVAVRTIMQTGIPYAMTTGPLGLAAIVVGVTVAAVWYLSNSD